VLFYRGEDFVTPVSFKSHINLQFSAPIKSSKTQSKWDVIPVTLCKVEIDAHPENAMVLREIGKCLICGLFKKFELLVN
jgi:hypothetical protein